MVKAASNKQAFGSVVGLVVENAIQSMNKFLELDCLYGRKGYGTIAVGGATNPSAPSTDVEVVLTNGQWSGIWAGFENVNMEFVDGTGTVVGSAIINAIDFDTRTIALTAPDNATAAAIATASGLGTLDLFIAGAYMSDIVPGARNEMIGLDAAITTSGNLWGINNAIYSVWKGNVYAVGGGLTLEKVIKALTVPTMKGLNEACTCFVSPAVWAELNADEAELRRYPTEKVKTVNGFEAITYHSQTGAIEIIGHPYIKQSEGFIFPTSRVKRVGASDVRFNSPKGDGQDYFNFMPEYEGYEMRCFSDQAFFLETPARAVKLTGITVS